MKSRKPYYSTSWLVWLALAITGAGIYLFTRQYGGAMTADDKQRALSVLFGSLLISSILLISVTSSWWLKR